MEFLLLILFSTELSRVYITLRNKTIFFPQLLGKETYMFFKNYKKFGMNGMKPVPETRFCTDSWQLSKFTYEVGIMLVIVLLPKKASSKFRLPMQPRLRFFSGFVS